MNILNIKTAFTFLLFISVNFLTYAQGGQLIVNQDAEITSLLALKKDINTTDTSTERYKIQIFSGKLSDAENSKSKYSAINLPWSSTLIYEEPNYKVWVGNYRTRLEADRALVDVKKTFYNAFIFKPIKKD